MAHAGTPTNLTNRPATSNTDRLWQAFIAAILVVALAAGAVAITANLAAKTSIVPAAEHGGQIQTGAGAVDIHKVVGHKGAMIYQ